MLRNTQFSYGYPAKLLHWSMAILFIAMFVLGYIMINMRTNARFAIYDLHKATGLLIFSLAIVRLIWRYVNPQPALPGSMPRWQKQAAEWNILALYGLMLLMPISGFLTSTLGNHPITFYHLFTIAPLANNKIASAWFSTVHEYLSILLIICFSLHVLAALYHHFILKDDVLRRMAK